VTVGQVNEQDPLTPEDQARTTALWSAWRFPAAAGGLVVAGAHLPVLAEHLREAPYLGVLFTAFSLLVLAAAAALLLYDTLVRYALLGAACLAAVLAYAATRLLAFPQGDVGNWIEPWGIVAVLSETLTATACVLGAEVQRYKVGLSDTASESGRRGG